MIREILSVPCVCVCGSNRQCALFFFYVYMLQSKRLRYCCYVMTSLLWPHWPPHSLVVSWEKRRFLRSCLMSSSSIMIHTGKYVGSGLNTPLSWGNSGGVLDMSKTPWKKKLWEVLQVWSQKIPKILLTRLYWYLAVNMVSFEILTSTLIELQRIFFIFIAIAALNFQTWNFILIIILNTVSSCVILPGDPFGIILQRAECFQLFNNLCNFSLSECSYLFLLPLFPFLCQCLLLFFKAVCLQLRKPADKTAKKKY